ncbi:MAG: hypothetical protein ACOC34_01220 [Thermotogota bacterium]
MSYLKQSDGYDRSGAIVKNNEQVSQKQVSLDHVLALFIAATKVVIITLVLLGAFLVPFLVGMETSRLKAETSNMQLDLHRINAQICDYNEKIAAFSDKIILNQKKAEK